MVKYRYMGYGTTDSNGIAKLDHNAQGQAVTHSYTGSGVGEVDIVASLDEEIVEGSIVSETYEIIDAYNVDTGTTSNTDWLPNSNLTITPSDDGKTVTNNTANQQAWDLNKHGTSTSTTYDFNLPLCVEMDIVSMTGEVRFMVTDNSSHVDRIDLTNITDKHLKIEFKEDKYRYYLDGVQIGEYNNIVVGDCRFRVLFTGNASFKFKNFMIYPV